MIFATRDEQRSFAEYVDVEFKDLVVKPGYGAGGGLPLYDWHDLMEYILDGYYINFCDVPEYILNEEFTGKNKRRFKKFVKKVFDKYGDSKSAISAHAEFDREMEALEEQFPIEMEHLEVNF